MRLLRLDDSQEGRWDDYVGKRTSTVTDLSAWRHVLHESYGINSHSLVVENEGALVGSLGLFEFRHPLFGHYLSTAAFATDGGLHFDSSAARDLLTEEAKRLADELRVDYLLIRSREPAIKGYIQARQYRTAVLDLKSGADALWQDTLPAKTRNQVRRGEKEGFTIQSGHDQIADFHRVFHMHMRDLGSPAHSRKYYQSILKYLGNQSQFLVVREGKNLVAGALLFEVNGTVMNVHTVSLKPYNRRCANYLLYWNMIKGSCERGNARFDMGRSEADSPTLKFKQNWGVQVVELNYNYYLRQGSDIPSMDPRDPRYQMLIATWKRLPLSLTRNLGPWLIRGIA